MCGRYSLGSSGEVIADHFDLREIPSLEPRYNIAPTQEVAVVGRNRGGGFSLGLMRWGLPGPDRKPLINVRSETALEAPTFRRLLSRRRCLVVADGYYDGARAGGRCHTTSGCHGASLLSSLAFGRARPTAWPARPSPARQAGCSHRSTAA